MYVVRHFCKNRRKQSSKKKTRRERRGTRLSLLRTGTSKEQLTSASDCPSLVHAGFWVVKEGKVSQRAPSSFLQKLLENFLLSYAITERKKEKRQLLTWMSAKTPKWNHCPLVSCKLSICCFLSVLYVSARLKSNQTKHQIRDISRKYIKRKDKAALKEEGKHCRKSPYLFHPEREGALPGVFLL